MSLLMDHTNRPGDVADPWYTGDFEAAWQDVREGYAVSASAVFCVHVQHSQIAGHTERFYRHFPQSLQPLQINLLPQVSQFARKWGRYKSSCGMG